MKNYRRAKKGDIKCSECPHMLPPSSRRKRMRCMMSNWLNEGMYGARQVVGKNMTCDHPNKAE
jgi:hypothetical protein